MVPVLMSAKMTTALVAVVGACVIGTGIVAGTVAENRAESTRTTRAPATVVVPVVSTLPPVPEIPLEPPPVPVPTPGPASAPVGPGETTGATTIGTTTVATAAGATTVATVDTSTTGPPLCFPCSTIPTITLPTLPEVTLPVTLPTVHLGAAASYAVLAAATVTNTGLSVITGNLGLSPGTSVTGFLPGLVIGVIDTANGAAGQAQSDLSDAYLDAAGRASTNIPGELGGMVLGPGAYAGPGRSPLHLTGTLTLDGGGDPGAVFIFQTDSTLTTASGSTVRLINGARACNVFWQVGSSATLGTGSTFAGTIMALASITVTTGVNVQGRVLARNAAVTLDSDIVTAPTC